MICFERCADEADKDGVELLSSESFRVNYGLSKSTSKLKAHLETKHKNVVAGELNAKATTAVKAGKTIHDYVDYESAYHQKALDWAIKTYQPLSTFDDPSFKEMIGAVSSKSGKFDISSRKMKEMMKKQAAAARVVLRDIIKDVPSLAITVDKWTSQANDAYVGVTAHYIDENWNLRALTLTCEESQSKGATAEEIYTCRIQTHTN